MVATSLPAVTAVRAKRTSFFNTLRAEWSKLVTLRSFYVSVAVTLLLAIGLSAGISLIMASTLAEWDAMSRAAFDPVLFSLFGFVFSSIVLTLIGVTFVAAEYQTGMIRLSLTVTPVRYRVLLAKVVIIALISVVIGLVSAFAAFLLGQAIFAANGAPSASLAADDVRRVLIVTGVTAAVWPLLGAGLAVLFRSTAAAIAAVLALIFTPPIFGAMLPAWWQDNVLRFLPDRAVDSITVGQRQASAMSMGGGSYLDPGVGILVTLGWIAIVLGAAFVVFQRRDV